VEIRGVNYGTQMNADKENGSSGSNPKPLTQSRQAAKKSLETLPLCDFV
jgi:hypothetical protein